MILLWHRLLLIFACLAVIGGSVGASLGFAYYLHSPAYRTLRTEDLAKATGLQAFIGRIQPLSFHSRQFNDIKLLIPNDGTEVFHCQQARWIEEGAAAAGAASLDIDHGWLLLGTHQWGASDYEKVLHSGFGHDFASLGLRKVRFSDVDLEWMHERFRLTFGGTTGDVLFEPNRLARAKLSTCTLNNEPLSEPVHVSARLTTGTPLVLHEVVLNVPRMSLALLGIEQVLQNEVTHGYFKGLIAIRETEGGLSVEAVGELEDALLPELTASVVGGPFSGHADLAVDQALFTADSLQSLRFRGRLENLKLSEVAPFLQMQDMPGLVELRVHQADISGQRINHLSASGKATDVSLEAVTRPLGYGLITGRLRVIIRDLAVVDDSLISADVELHAEPPNGGTGMIDRELVKFVSSEWLGIDVSAVLPEKIPYTKFGVRLILNQGRLYLRGTHGTEGKTMLTVKVFNREWAVLNAPNRSFEVPDLVALLRAQASQQSPEDLRKWWEEQHGEAKR